MFQNNQTEKSSSSLTTPHQIPILDLKPEIDAHWDEFNQAIQSVLKVGQFILGPNVKLFEKEVGKFLGTKHVIGVNSGTDALVIGLKALGIGPGDEVLTTPFTFFATAESISQVGATPVFIDIEPKTFTIDAEKLARKISPKTKAIIPVHIYGHPALLGEILDISRKYNLAVLEDVAQAFGAEYCGQKVGTFGQVSAFSLFPSKNLGAFGDGGLIATNDDNIAEQVRMLRVHGARKKYYNECLGYNSRLDEMQAAVLRVKLRYISQTNQSRREAAHYYNQLLADVKGVVTPHEASYAKHVYHQYTIRISNGKRDSVYQYLASRGITTLVYYPVPCHQLAIYADRYESLPNTEKLTEEILSLPIWPGILPETQKTVVQELTRALSDH